MTSSSPAIVLFSHGSRDPLWRAPLEAVERCIRHNEPGRLVQSAYLELCTPSLPEAVADLVQQGAKSVRVVPMFLGTGKHAREDLPHLLDQLRQQHPNVTITAQPAIGENPRLTALMAEIACDQQQD